ncbi:MAG TPA: hypothetical protein VF546_24255 [Pyrinomonadaceae bacterium]|jgi:hypothetical protein
MKRPLPVLPPSPLPPLYAAWVEQFLAGPLPHERDATCDDCAMCAAEGQTVPAGEVRFNPQTKCCAYIPQLPNFLVGRVLTDDDPAAAAGRATVEARLRAGINATPLGLGQPPDFALLYEQSATTLFGQSRALRCPHYLAEAGGRCGVWAHRAAVCATWFCKYERGATGQSFWQALHRLLAAAEQSLARWCVLELDPGGAAFEQLFAPAGAARGGIDPRALDGTPDPAARRALWGAWAGREADYYRACARLVGALKWADVLAIGGTELRLQARLTGAAYRRLTAAGMPAALKVGAFSVIRLSADAGVVCSYSGFDPVELPRPLLDVLHYFDGRPAKLVLAAIAAEQGVTISRGLLRKLIDFQILLPCEPPARRERTRPTSLL